MISKHSLLTLSLCSWLCALPNLEAAKKAVPPSPEELSLQADMKAKELEIKELKKRLYQVKQQQLSQNKGQIKPYQTSFHLPKLDKAPKIDGVMEVGEWDKAIAVTTGAGIRNPGLKERPSAVAYIGWDADHIYVSQRLPLREGEKLKRLKREPKHDNVHPSETSWEFYIDRDSHGSHPSHCKWQFMANAVGNKWDMEHQPQIGQKFYGWDAKWDMKQSLSPDGKAWILEAAIPRTSVYQKEPITDGSSWKIGLATNLHNPWTWSGFYGATIPVIFKNETPHIGLYHPERTVAKRSLAFELKCANTTSEPVTLKAVALLRLKNKKDLSKDLPSEIRREHSLQLSVGESANWNMDESLGELVADHAAYALTVQVLKGEEPIYTWTRDMAFNAPRNKVGLHFEPDPNPFSAFVNYAPISNYIRGEVDIYDFDHKDKVTKALISIESEGKSLLNTEVSQFEYGKGKVFTDIPSLDAGTYDYKVRLVDAQGRELATLSQDLEVRDLKDFPWIGNDLGEDDVVPEMFEALKPSATPEIFQAHLKTIKTAASGLPEQIEVRGDKLLHAPLRVEAIIAGQAQSWKSVSSKPVTTKSSATTVAYEGQLLSSQLKLKTQVKWQYDSTAKVQLDIEPTQNSAQLDGLRLVIPFSKEASLNFMCVGDYMRQSCRAGRIPTEVQRSSSDGDVVWNSQEVPNQSMTVGSFVPVAWIGNRSMGMTWFADSDEGWFPNDEQPALELIRRKDGGVNLVLNFCSSSSKLDAPRSITFGLNVNPIRKMSEHKPSPITFGKPNVQGRWVPGKSGRREFALRYPQDPEFYKAQSDAFQKYGSILSPYTEMSKMDLPEDVYTYFKEEWYTQRFGMSPNDIANDALMYYSQKTFTELKGNGYYFDNVFPRASRNVRAGTAYTLPDGRIQPGYSLWAYRDHFKRMRVLLDQTERPNRICIHNTRFQFAPVMAFADLAMGGEMATPKMGTPDFMDMYPRDFMEVMYNTELWGYKLSHLYHYKWRTFINEFGEPDLDAARKIHRGAQASFFAHGVEFFGGINWDASRKLIYRMLKSMCGGSMEFTPWWKSAGKIELSEPQQQDRAVSIFHGEKGMVVIFSNFSKKSQKVKAKIDFPALLDIPNGKELRMVMDLDQLEAKKLSGIRFLDKLPEGNRFFRLQNINTLTCIPNTLEVDVAARDYRAFIITNVSLSKGTGF